MTTVPEHLQARSRINGLAAVLPTGQREQLEDIANNLGTLHAAVVKDRLEEILPTVQVDKGDYYLLEGVRNLVYQL